MSDGPLRRVAVSALLNKSINSYIARPSRMSRTYTLYLIRHGEAHHNVREKQAQEHAREAALAEGLSPEETEIRVELARQAILVDPSFFDAPLSLKGIDEAVAARELLQQWFQTDSTLTPPTDVLVSPLQRTLQTADVLFPDIDNVHVREELRERLTGRPADNRVAAHIAAQGTKFRRFSFNRLRMNSVVREIQNCCHNLIDSWEEDEDEEQQDSLEPSEPDTETPKWKQRFRDERAGSSFNTDEQVEDEEMLQERTRKLFRILQECESTSVAVVTHKGYLRGLEKGTLRQEKVENFSNCEIRVYRVEVQEGTDVVEAVERLK